MSVFISAIFLFPAVLIAQKDKPAYKNPELLVEHRVNDLLARMTLEEKAAQTFCLWQTAGNLFHEDGTFNRQAADTLLTNGMGHIARLCWGYGPKEGAERTNAVQKYLMENTRLGIPVIFHGEGLHGYQAEGATHFPQAIALASTWDPELHEQIFQVVAKEMRARGTAQAFTPVLGLARDPRWGRTEETYGEDPYLISRMGVACVKGFQGEGPTIGNDHVISTVKHYAVYSQPERGINYGPGNYSERIIRDQFLLPFYATITEAGALSVMPSYNEIDGIPAHANKKFLQRILREDWGFEGFIVSDYSGVSHLHNFHFVAHDKYEAAKMALEAGIDIELPDIDCYGTLVEQIRGGRISEAVLDKAVKRVLKAKFLLGLFDDPYVEPDKAVTITNCKEHRDLALKAAYKAAVLLKNESNLLPLDKSKIKSIAVVGPNAGDIHLGGYSWEPRTGISILEGLKNKVGDKIKIRYSEGCKITKGIPLWIQDESELADPEENRKLIKEAVKVAHGCDVVVCAVGGNEATCREGWAQTHLGDRHSLDMVGEQNDLVKALAATGKPVVVILINGRPLSINWVNENVPAIIEGWYLGQETGTAVADILFGDYNPGGKLPITFPRSVGHLPAYYNHKPTISQNYLFETKEPLFPFGYGLSYTTFFYSNLRVTPKEIGPSGKAKVSVDITNTGKVEGDEVAQMYIRDVVSSVTRPVKELKGFERVTIKPGETVTVHFELTPGKLSFTNEHMERVVEPGEFKIMVGTNSKEYETAILTVVER
ncbi:MAG: glycoside hydrolase family 3 C-terminal domain-containing protein [Candidatus Latescibacteria bacterium]|nr:glycoside hydrolase family 3 C-terminal domain-containing protein [Candidatus Latescibacterota bacterium]